MKRSVRRWILLAASVAALAVAYPAFVLGFTWYHVARSELPGGGNGPRDAYRHTLASAVVAFTLGPRAVEWVIARMEHGAHEAARMDRQNNRVGARIGAAAESLVDIEPAVREKVLHGATYAEDPEQITWLKPRRWRNNWLW